MTRVVFGGAMRPTSLRFKRSTAEAFKDEMAYSVTHYLSMKPSHRAMRFVRRFLRWLAGSRP